MTAIHQYKCDHCERKINADWNGEHWLAPKEWVEINGAVDGKNKGHLCNQCWANKDKSVVVSTLKSKLGRRAE